MVDAPDGGVLDERMNTESGHPQDRENTVDCAVESAAIDSRLDRPMSPVHSIHRRPAHSGALFSWLPATSPVLCTD